MTPVQRAGDGLGAGLSVERLARALHEANVDCDYSRRFDRKSCIAGDGPHTIMAEAIVRAYTEDHPGPWLCTYRDCGRPETDPAHPGPDERKMPGQHVFRHEVGR